MGSVILNKLKKIDEISPDYTFVDFHLDLQEANVLILNGRANNKSKDIKVDYDEAAIRNSIINIFNTIPGERFLIPEFGCSLRKYLFKPITESTAREIGKVVLNAIELWEPRVSVEYVNVIARPIGTILSKNTERFTSLAQLLKEPARENEYIINMIVSIPRLKYKIDLNTILTESGVSEIKTMYS